jgi:hypothetical protein
MMNEVSPQQSQLNLAIGASMQDPQTNGASAPKKAYSKETTDERLAAFRQQVEESGITDEDLDRLFEELREEVWQENQSVHP